MRISERSRIAVTLAIAASICAFGTFNLWNRWTWTWVRISEGSSRDSDTYEQRVRRKLEQITSSGVPRQGSEIELAVFRGVGARQVSLRSIEGTLTDSSIEPDDPWSHLGNGILLVNSVDEWQSVPDAGIASHIGLGCNLRPANRLAVGDVEIHPCEGPYRTRYGIDWVANVAIVLPNSNYDDSCYKFTANSHDREQCIERVLAVSLKSLSRKLNARDQKPSAIIFPALATGIGDLRKTSFYQVLFEGLHDWMKSPQTQAALPEKVYMLIWSGEGPEKWDQTKEAVIPSLSNLAYDWQQEMHADAIAVDTASLVGVSAGVMLVMIAALTKKAVPMLSKQITEIRARKVFFVAGAWYLSSLGAVSALRIALSAVPHIADPLSQLALGIVAVFAAGPLIAAQKAFEKMATGS